MAKVLPYSALAAYEWSDTAMWVFDLGRRCMNWANPAGLQLWNAPTLSEFMARDFSQMSEATVSRNLAMMAEHAAGRLRSGSWILNMHLTPTLSPARRGRGKPTATSSHDCDCV